MGRRWAILAIVVAGAAACTSSRAATAPKVPPPSIGPDAPRQVASASLRDAVTTLLRAEQKGDSAASFVLLTDEARATYRDIPRWKARRDELPVVKDFQVVGRGPGANSVDVLVAHPPGLDPYRGLSPAHDHETWTGRHEHGGWLVDADPAAKPVIPSESGVAAAATAWVEAAEACDQAAIHRTQAVDPLLGIGYGSQQFCHQHLNFTVSAPSTLPPGDMAQQLIAQYSADALLWARMVTLSGASAPIEVLLAPIGDGWQVIGLYA